MRAKMVVRSIKKDSYAETLEMGAVVTSANSPEDNSFAAATPSAKLEIQISNKDLWGMFAPDDKFYVDFTPTN